MTPCSSRWIARETGHASECQVIAVRPMPFRRALEGREAFRKRSIITVTLHPLGSMPCHPSRSWSVGAQA